MCRQIGHSHKTPLSWRQAEVIDYIITKSITTALYQPYSGIFMILVDLLISIIKNIQYLTIMFLSNLLYSSIYDICVDWHLIKT